MSVAAPVLRRARATRSPTRDAASGAATRRRRACSASRARGLGAPATTADAVARSRARDPRAHDRAASIATSISSSTNVEARGRPRALRGDRRDDAVRSCATSRAEHGVKRVVKSKSMVTEEIELNHALEAAGMRVVETDLGEYVVQLANDRPSHIIAPIIHKTREQVAELFREKLGATDADVADIPRDDAARAPHAARGVPRRRHGHQRRELRRRRDRQPLPRAPTRATAGCRRRCRACTWR